MKTKKTKRSSTLNICASSRTALRFRIAAKYFGIKQGELLDNALDSLGLPRLYHDPKRILIKCDPKIEKYFDYWELILCGKEFPEEHIEKMREQIQSTEPYVFNRIQRDPEEDDTT